MLEGTTSPFKGGMRLADTFKERPDFQPMMHLTESVPPTYIVYGGADTMVNPTATAAFLQGLGDKGIPHESQYYAEGGASFFMSGVDCVSGHTTTWNMLDFATIKTWLTGLHNSPAPPSPETAPSIAPSIAPTEDPTSTAAPVADPTKKPTTAAAPSPAGTGGICTTECGTCVRSASAYASVTDEKCALCAKGQTFWPCNDASLCDCAAAQPTQQPTSGLSFIPLRTVTAQLTNEFKSLGLGAAVNVRRDYPDATYQSFVCENFDWITAENGCKWRYTQEDNPKYKRCDTAVDFAERCQMKIRGHALVWGQEGSNIPDLTSTSTLSADAKRQLIIDHITEFMNRYKGRVAAYDVVNEAVCDCVSFPGSKFKTCAEFVATDAGALKCGYSSLYNTYLKRNGYWPAIEDYIGLSFTTARAVDPDASLGYNEYKFESAVGYGSAGGYLSEKGVQVYNLIKSLTEQGIPIDYVGCQGHIDVEYQTDYIGYIDSVKQYTRTMVNDLGVQWHFTEVDVSGVDTADEMPEDEKATQAVLYRGLMEVCLELGVTSCPVFQTWGVADKYVTPSTPFINPYLFDKQLLPKPAYDEIVAALQGAQSTEELVEERGVTSAQSTEEIVEERGLTSFLERL